MTIYVIRSTDEFDNGAIVQVTTYASSVAVWRNSSADYLIEEHQDATPEEQAQVDALNEWLYDNYNNGAHWIVETTDRAQHVVALREKSIDQYKRELSRHWNIVEDHAAEIRAA